MYFTCGFHSVSRNCCVSTPKSRPWTRRGGFCFHSVSRNCCVSTGLQGDQGTFSYEVVSIPSAGIAVFQRTGRCSGRRRTGAFPFRQPELLCFNGSTRVLEVVRRLGVSIPSAGIAVFQHLFQSLLDILNQLFPFRQPELLCFNAERGLLYGAR